MSRYVYGSGVDYPQYLQNNVFAEDIKTQISNSSQSIIASDKRLQKENLMAIRGVESGINQLSYSIQDVSRGQQELKDVLQWQFTNLISSVDALRTSIERSRESG